MADRGVGSILVLSDGGIVGMCTERSLLRRLVVDRTDPATMRLADVMMTPVLCADPDMPIDDALAVMTRTHTRHLPVVRGGRLLAIVSIGDLTHWLITELAGSVDDLTRYISGSTAARNVTSDVWQARVSWIG